LFFYFLLAYAITWILLIPYTLSAWGIIQGDWTVAFILHTFGPALAAIALTGIIEGKTGLQGLRNRVRQWGVGWQWLLFIFAVIPALLMFGVVAQPGAMAGFLGVSVLTVIRYPLYYFGVWFGGGPLGEEIGWRGFALPRMQPRYGPLWGTLFLGVLWACWHLEDFLTPAQGGGPGTGWPTFLTNFPIFLAFVVALAIIMTWIFNHTRGSLFAAISAHASVDTPQLALIPLFPAVGNTSLILGGAMGLGVLAVLILIQTRGRLGYRPAPIGKM
jgi:membrane protease YdiL (CAAX protease family)